MQLDVAIVGAGPAGLCLAQALGGLGLQVVVFESQPLNAVAQPAFDGREIALTHASQRLLQQYGVWQHIPQDEIFPLRQARVMDGYSPFAMQIEAGAAPEQQLGFLVPNVAIRQAAYNAFCELGQVQLHGDSAVQAVQRTTQGFMLQLTQERRVSARLLVAADSRFSATRRLLGIGASMRDYGRSMLLCRMQHEQPHHHAAWEWFGYGQTLALLPLSEGLSSVVLTLPQHELHEVSQLSAADFSADITRRFGARLGEMSEAGSRHCYPLVGVYSHRFMSENAALVGDAAVGMHPVTAHGFNLGLQSVQALSTRIAKAHDAGDSIHSTALLRDYENAHRRASWPMYQATNCVAGLYTDDRAPAKVLRKLALHVANRLPPFKRAIAAHLTQAA